MCGSYTMVVSWSVLLGPQYLGMTEWEKQRERTEFAKAADVYQPLATSLESKFTRGETAMEDEKKQVKSYYYTISYRETC